MLTSGEFQAAPCGRLEISKLPIYAGLGVAEVWSWENEAFHLHALRDGLYEEISASVALPALDLAVVARFARTRDQDRAAKAFRDWLHQG